MAIASPELETVPDTELDFRTSILSVSDLGADIKTDVDVVQNIDSGQGSSQDTQQIVNLIQEPIQETVEISEKNTSDNVTIPDFISPTGGDGGSDSFTLPPPIIDIDFGGRRRMTKKKQEDSFFGEVKVGNKYQRVTKKPYTKSGALDRVARIVDNTISAQGRIVPSKSKKTPAKGDGYYKKNQDKFRGFKMFKGKQVPVKNTIIEKKNRRLDTLGETQRLTVAQFTARSSKRAAGLPTRRGKKKKAPFRL